MTYLRQWSAGRSTLYVALTPGAWHLKASRWAGVEVTHPIGRASGQNVYVGPITITHLRIAR